jgi:threonine dehydrogenase-like Zn-dependent dehydrogenase
MQIPSIQNAIELVGADQIKLNGCKRVFPPGPYQILAHVEAVGLCFSDLKLLKQFDKHVRKGEVISGINKEILKEVPSYRPGPEPTIPGHETLCTIVATGEKVSRHRVGEHVLVQADYRWLKTAKSNAAFGYNFEGALQQYVLMDERVITDPQRNESSLIPVEEQLSASSLALVEPWACVESSYTTQERNAILPGGKLLVAADDGRHIEGLRECFSSDGGPVLINACCVSEDQFKTILELGLDAVRVDYLESLPDEGFDDIIYFGSNPASIELLNDKLAAGGIINIVLGGHGIGRQVSIGVGRVHYSRTRWIGTTANNASESYRRIPVTGEIRKSDKALIVGAAGPMGQMHTIRLLRCGVEGISITCTDIDNERLESLKRKACAVAEQSDVQLSVVNPAKEHLQGKFSYFVIMAPVGSLVAQAIKDSMEGALINLFAGIPAMVRQKLDLDRYIANKCFMFGASGSRLSDMKVVLEKVLAGNLDTDCCVDAVSGMAGAVEGIRAVENRTMAGKIIVYPQLKDLPLMNLPALCRKFPSVAEKLNDGMWSKDAEEELFHVARQNKAG